MEKMMNGSDPCQAKPQRPRKGKVGWQLISSPHLRHSAAAAAAAAANEC